MKLNFHVSPSLRGPLTTQRIMKELTCGLLIIFVLAVINYTHLYGSAYGLQCVWILACSLVTMFICEYLFAKIRKRDPKKEIKHSFGWVTAIILALMMPVSVPLYAVIVSTIFAIVFAKMIFGGFGHNIFNPAAVGRAVIFASFTGATTDLVTSATPTAYINNTYGWLPANENVLDAFLQNYGGWKGLFLGTYPGALGETFTLAIVIIGIFLIVRKIIDWRVPVVYLGTIFVMTAIIAIITGIGPYHGIPGFLWYPVLHLLLGGVVFGAFFMLTDPVTSPTSAAGRTIFALGAGILTVLIRMTGNLPEGCLYSILLMNMMTPLIESALDGKQLDILKKAKHGFIYLCIVGLALTIFAACKVHPVTNPKGESEAKVVEQTEVDIL
ncbi:MAG: RnfABCDGE type electron transport complex subunit D [Absicoccus sp.]|uniref:RnfABCDGE type electron transport complex subunit D n=1 Tax=Absicoccus intestinalis TaxID=2926319 RepID=A0ABU4WKR8_9FIRM|nr:MULTISPECIES: RnfABCDGE type electron transport complex subunit D [unclassified Absicoccus]MDX8416666.1 RnfABCDGE type electron transport complex subunit D [Absicoccus sp. CLA-KB-P134]MDY3035207.1 RnfABCDGE type electron transport complex subunit D [Absicoccus sp.]